MKTAFINLTQKEKFYFLSIVLITAIIFAILNFLTPLIGDDFAYLYKFGPIAQIRPTNIPVKNISDILESQYYFYQVSNGRFFSLFLLEISLLLGKNIFNILNVLVFISVILLIYNYQKKILKPSENIFLLLFVILCIWLFAPFFGQTMLWETGAFNYLWATFFVVLFLHLFRKQTQNSNSASYFKLILFFIFSFLIAGTNESVTFGVAAALFIFMLTNFKKLKPISWVMIIGFGLGVLAIVFSPGTISRAHHDVATYPSLLVFFKQKFIEFIGIISVIKFPIAISILLIVVLKFRKINIIEIFIREKIIVLSIFFNCLFFLIIGNVEVRMLFGTIIFMTLFNKLLLEECLKFLSFAKLFFGSIIISCILLVVMYNSLIQVNDYKKKNIIFENELKNKNSKVFYFPYFKDSRFVYNMFSGIIDSKNYHNRVRSFYYGLPEINILPFTLYHEIFTDLILEKENNWNALWQQKLLFSAKEDVAIIKLPADFVYTEQLMLKISYINKEKKKTPLNIIPINNFNYAFAENVDFNSNKIVEIEIVNDNGIVIERIQKKK